jgi:hypothetical protein
MKKLALLIVLGLFTTVKAQDNSIKDVFLSKSIAETIHNALANPVKNLRAE